MSNLHKPHLAVPTERGSIHHIWQLNGCVKWQCSRSKHQYFVCLIVHSIYQWIVLNLWFGRSRGYSKLWEFFRNLKVDSLLEYSTLRWAHKWKYPHYVHEDYLWNPWKTSHINQPISSSSQVLRNRLNRDELRPRL